MSSSGDDSAGWPGERSAGVQRILRNSTLSLAAQIGNAFAQVIVVLLVARRLGSTALGELYPLLDLVTFVQLVSEAGTGTVLTRRLVQMPKERERIIAEARSIFAIIMVLSIAGFGAIGLVWWALQADVGALLRCVLAGIACAFIHLQRFASGIFRASDMFGVENLSRVLQGIAFAILVGVLFLAGAGSLSGVVVAFMISQGAAGVFLLLGVQKQWIEAGRWQFSIARWRNWLGESVHLGSGDVVRQLMWQMDTIVIRILHSPAAAGVFSLAYKPLGPINWLPRAVLTAAFPSLARMATGGRNKLESAFAHSSRLLWLMSIPIAVTVAFGAEPLVKLMSGKNYSEFEASVGLLRVLIWITALAFLSAQFRFVLAAVGSLPGYTRLATAAFVLKAVLEFALVPRLSYYGALVACLAGELAFTFLGLALCKKLGIGSIDRRMGIGALFAGAVMASTFFVSMLFIETTLISWLVESLIATIIYIAVCLSTGVLERKELVQLIDSLRGREV
jgi:O-antigen/teichoic acid export membrane protein